MGYISINLQFEEHRTEVETFTAPGDYPRSGIHPSGGHDDDDEEKEDKR